MPRQRSRVAEYGGKTDKYEWDQTEEEVTLWFQVPENTRGRDVDCVIEPHNLRVALKGQAPILEGRFHQRVNVELSTWTLDSDNHEMEVTLQKTKPDEWWKCVLEGDPEIDVDLIEGSKYLDDSLLKKVKESKLQKKREEEERQNKLKQAQEKQEAD